MKLRLLVEDTFFVLAIVWQCLAVGLKLAGVIDWNWHLVLIPAYACAASFIPAIFIGFAMRWRVWRNTRKK